MTGKTPTGFAVLVALAVGCGAAAPAPHDDDGAGGGGDGSGGGPAHPTAGGAGDPEIGAGGQGGAGEPIGGDSGAPPVDTNIMPSPDAGAGNPDPDGWVPTLMAVGYGAVRVVSQDNGRTWVKVAKVKAGGGDDRELLRAVAFGNRRWVTAGFRMFTSDDGTQWAEREIPAACQPMTGLAFGAGRFVAACGNRTLFSADGLAWSDGGAIGQSVGGHVYLLFSGGQFVASGDSGPSFVSTDGAAWKPLAGVTHATDCEGHLVSRSRCATQAWFEGAYYREAWRAVIERSEDGKVWTRVFEDVPDYNVVHWFTRGMMPPLRTDPASDSPSKNWVFIMLGQSNMSGTARCEDQDRSAPARVFKLARNKTWAPGHEAFNIDAFSSLTGAPCTVGELKLGPSRSFAINVLVGVSDQQVNLYLVNAAISGSNIESWDPKTGGNFTNMLPLLDEGLKRGVLRGFIWHQGESNSGMATAEYAGKLAAIIKAIRDRAGQPDLPVVAGELGTASDDGRVNLALAQLAASDPRFGVATSENLTLGDNVHYNSASQREYGRRYAAVWLGISKP